MNRENAKIRIEELRGILEDANRRYYVENAPTISDRDFDELFGKYPKETTELFGLMCFIDPSEIDSYNGMELTAKCIDMLGDENVATFLVSLSKILR